ncbi:SpoIIE family protein phosphatase [Streptomyces sp. NBC_01497]|uniref:SpoIIE family protein phosphatase n=1 Tax=Streptomyces sp. NBC_01497 TaxID=2903885 RepID=UPI002E2EACF1|nr:SpoIIE family protein phosphatase [Streptomyces sp. NBC_01497]
MEGSGPVRDDQVDLPQEDARRVLDAEVGRVGRSTGAHIVAGYLDVPEERLVRMTVVRGVPARLARSWSRVARVAQVPVAQAVRSGRPVWLSGQQELARRFPRTALSFPYRVAMYVAPLVDAGVSWGALLLLWPGTRSPELSLAEEREVGAACRRAAKALRMAAEAGDPVLPRPDPLALDPPPESAEPRARLTDRLPGGMCELDLDGRLTFINARALELLDRDRGELLHHDPFEVIPWLHDPAFENAYLAAVFSRLPSALRVRHPSGHWLSFTLYADDFGVTFSVEQAGLPADRARGVTASPSDTPAHAGTLFHLLHLASALAEAKTVQEIDNALTEQMMPVLAVQAFALLTAEDGRLRVVTCEGFPAEMAEFFDGILLTSPVEGVRAVESGVPSFHSDASRLPDTEPAIERYGRVTAFAYLPLTVSGRTIGCCVLGYERPQPFVPNERAELVSLAGLIAQALERARLYDLNAQAARGLQEGLLPSRLPRIDGLQTAARYRPAMSALDVGGDFYDLIALDDAVAVAVVGDVQGHSVQAAALMGQVRTAVHTHAQVGAPPGEVLARTNRLLEDLNTELFASCLYAHLDLRRRRALLASAGHLPPVLRGPDGRAEVLDVPPGLLLGVEPEASFPTTEIPLAPGSVLALYTDGLVERSGTDLGDAIDDLARRVGEAPPGPLSALCDRLISGAEATMTQEKSDDIALLLLRTGHAAPV